MTPNLEFNGMRQRYGRRDGRTHNYGHLMVGLALMTVGLLFLLDTLNIAETGYLISRGWPLILIGIGLGKLVRGRTWEGRIGGIGWLYIGTLFQLSRLGYISFSVWGLIWPTALMALGLFLVVRSRYARTIPNESTSLFSATTFMGGVERKINSQTFEGGDITAVMGGVGMDLREASIGEVDAVIDLFVWAGGVELMVPEDWVVVGKVVPIMGAYEDNTKPKTDSRKRLVIRGLVLMGGVEVKNS